MPLPVSIVIPAHNRHRVLPLMAPSYLRQGCAELIVVDDASNPPLEPIASTTETRVTHIRLEKHVNQPEARMIGARRASQEYIFFGEDEVFLADGCIKNLWDYLRSGDYDIVAPRWITVKTLPDDSKPPAPGRPVSRAEQVINYQLIQIACCCQPLEPIRVPWLHTPALMPRETVLRVGFDAGYAGYAYREETDFYLRAQAAGARLAFVPGPPAYHYKGLINTSGAREARRLLFTEYWVLRNSFRFMRKNQPLLRMVGGNARPYAGTALLAAARIRWYWRRLLHKLFRPADEAADIPL